ncbi:TonB-dependent receptor [Asticcacaulis sp.]|uniref:TonB-dependent receptor n=1 Tax=Asticcacaulis sp. TaxID=1872648 RepID=UPI0039E43141
MAATGLSVAMMSVHAFAQDTTTKEPTAEEKAATAKAEAQSDEVIIVRGVRGSMKDSASKKRKSKQISDTVSAEDAGKLPDNNVTEALAHLTGVQIQRQHGEGTDIAIRGIQEVGTTVNGNAVGGGNMRSMNHNAENGGTCTIAMIAGQCNDQGPTLSDVPAALIKEVTVYKTRTADQVEGGIGGVVNVELRRPLDLQKGWTVAGSYRMAQSSIGNTLSPYTSLLVAKRFDTGIGEMGFLVNLGYEQNRYQEDHLVTETVQKFYSSGTITTADGSTEDASGSPYLTAYRVWNGTQKGTRSRPTANLAYQWRPNENLDFVIEGTWLGSRETSENNYASLKTSGDANPDYTDLVTQADGVTVKSMTVNTGSSGSNNYLEFISAYWKNKSDTYTTNFETHYHTDKLQINGSIQYNWSNYYSNSIYQDLTVDGIDSASIDFDNGGKPSISLSNADALNDISNYNMLNFHQGMDNSFSRDFNGQIDLTYQISDTFPIRSVQAGIRQTSHFSRYYTAYRDAAISSNALSDFAGGAIPVVYSALSGSGIAGFYHLDNAALLNNWDTVLSYLSSSGVSDNWTTTDPDDKDNNSYSEKEFTFAWYGQFNYAFNAYFPVDGVIGVRVVNTDGQSENTWFQDAYTNSSGVTVAAVRGDAVSAGSYRDILPSYNATIHFRKDLQLRLAYTYMVQRPAFSQLAGGVHLTYGADGTATSGWGGNPDLQPMKGPNYDASLEYYFGQGGMISFAAYLKKPEHQIIYYTSEQSFPELGITTPITYGSYFNAGQGTYQGFEFNAQSFFEFLPGFWKHFGAGFNYTYNQIYKLEYPAELEVDGYVANHAPWTSKDTYNIQLFYDTPTFNARVAYNYRSKYLSDINTDYPEYTYVNDATSRLDVSLAWTPVKNWTYTLEGTNLLGNNQVGYYGYTYFPAEVRKQARTIQIGARFRY